MITHSFKAVSTKVSQNHRMNTKLQNSVRAWGRECVYVCVTITWHITCMRAWMCVSVHNQAHAPTPHVTCIISSELMPHKLCIYVVVFYPFNYRRTKDLSTTYIHFLSDTPVVQTLAHFIIAPPLPPTSEKKKRKSWKISYRTILVHFSEKRKKKDLNI